MNNMDHYNHHLVEPIRKNYEERMNEYVNILNREECLPGCKVLDVWRFHLELILEKSGWIALYKPSSRGVKKILPPSEFNCEILMVERVDFNNFEAFVIGADQSETSAAASSDSSSVITNKTFCVPLDDLYPCTRQVDADLDGIEIANILDQFRFFRANLWLPWDEEDENEDWRLTCLEPRMQLMYDMDQGLVSCEVVERVKRLWRQAWELHDHVQTLEVDIDDNKSPVPSEAHVDDEEGLVIKIMQIHHKLDSIKHELERLHNPLIRNLMIREKQRMLRRTAISELPWSRLVWGGGSTQSLGELISEVSVLTGTDQRLKIYPLLPMALEEANAGDFVFLSSDSSHTVTGSAGLETGGVIKGLGKEKSKVSGSEAGDVMLDINCGRSNTEEMDDGENITKETSNSGLSIANVTLEAYNLEICLLVNVGDVLLENCLIDGGGSHNKDDSVGALLRSGARLVAKNCTFTGFNTALIAYHGAEVQLINCQLNNCEMGIQLYKGATLLMEGCKITDCSSHGIYYKWTSYVPSKGNKILAQDLLNSLPGVAVSDTEFKGVPLVMQISDDVCASSSNNNCS